MSLEKKRFLFLLSLDDCLSRGLRSEVCIQSEFKIKVEGSIFVPHELTLNKVTDFNKA